MFVYACIENVCIRMYWKCLYTHVLKMFVYACIKNVCVSMHSKCLCTHALKMYVYTYIQNVKRVEPFNMLYMFNYSFYWLSRYHIYMEVYPTMTGLFPHGQCFIHFKVLSIRPRCWYIVLADCQCHLIQSYFISILLKVM